MDEQLAGIIRETDRQPVADVTERHGISAQAIHTWRKRFGALRTEDLRRLRQLEAENARLKKPVAERALEIEGMREAASKMLVSGRPVGAHLPDNRGPNEPGRAPSSVQRMRWQNEPLRVCWRGRPRRHRKRQNGRSFRA